MGFNRVLKVSRTRKDHACWGCTGKIPKGSSALYQVDFNDDFGLHCVYYCETCTAFLDAHPRYFDETGIGWGDVREAIKEEERLCGKVENPMSDY